MPGGGGVLEADVAGSAGPAPSRGLGGGVREGAGRALDDQHDLDVNGFYKILYDRKVTACGYGAIAATMIASKELGATEGKLLKYATSGDVSGDKSSVVGYASIIFT